MVPITLLLILLKALGLIALSWWWIWFTLWFPIVAVICVWLLFAGFAYWVSHR